MVKFLRWESGREGGRERESERLKKKRFSQSKGEKSLFEGGWGVLRKKGRRD